MMWFVGTRINAPKHLSEHSKRLYRNILKEYALEDDRTSLEILRLALEAVDRTEQARQMIAAEGLTVTNEKGVARPHPAVAIERDNRLAVARLFRELGLSDGESYDSARPPRTDGALV